MGSTYLNAFIPTTAFGKEFNAGISHDISPEERLGYIMGLSGAAYALNANDIIQLLANTLETEYDIPLYFPNCPCACLATPLSWLGIWTPYSRLSPPTVNNFTYNLKNSALNADSELTFADAGLAINLAFQPLLRRNVKLYIVCDAAGDDLSTIANEMHRVEQYGKNR